MKIIYGNLGYYHDLPASFPGGFVPSTYTHWGKAHSKANLNYATCQIVKLIYE